MCGIAGYFGSARLEPKAIETGLGTMRRRGPDAVGSYEHRHASGTNVYLLHSRLKIIDLDNRANQPFREGHRCLVFNGEIYNYVELKNQFAGNTPFRTTSDTEILMRILGQEGEKGLSKCNGMWAFAHYDEKNGTLQLSRDRFAEKPLYLYRTSDGIYFGSEVKFIRALLGKSLEINEPHLLRYLVNGYRSLYKTGDHFFKNLTEVTAGETWTFDGSLKEKRNRYWQMPLSVDSGMTYEDCVEAARESLLEAVKIRLRADVPLAFCMSGGIDSNTLISIAKRKFNYDVHGFTIIDSDSRYDESKMVEEAVRELGIRHTAVATETKDFLPRLRQLIKQHDSPVYTISYYAHWLLMEKIAQQGYKISLSGTGADELFTGYYDHHLAYLKEIQGEGALFSSAKEAWSRHVKPIVRNPYLNKWDLFVQTPAERRYLYLDAKTNSDFLRQPWEEAFQESSYTKDLLRNRMLNELFTESVPVILHEDDLNAMYYSIENRSPFLDPMLFEACFRMPTKHLIRDGMAKAVLRDAMRGIVPQSILDNRRKTGFNAAILSFLDLKKPSVKDELLGTSPIFQWVDREKVSQLLNDDNALKGESKFLFNFLNAKIFLEEFTGGQS